MEKSSEIVKGNRIVVIDALRGFALLGVVLVHMQQHYSIFNFGAFAPTEPLFPVLDEWISWLNRNVLMGRFINIFAFLFGMSFFIQMDRAAKKGVDPSMALTGGWAVGQYIYPTMRTMSIGVNLEF